MKKLLLTLAASAALIGTASAGEPVTSGGCSTCGTSTSHGFGHKLKGWGFGLGIKGHSLGHGKLGGGFGGGFGGAGGMPGQYATGGQLAFPQNPYIRSPRDFFMTD